jgi:hypothetical protein
LKNERQQQKFSPQDQTSLDEGKNNLQEKENKAKQPPMVVELVKQHEIMFNSLPHFFVVVMGSNPLAVVLREPNATKKGLY